MELYFNISAQVDSFLADSRSTPRSRLNLKAQRKLCEAEVNTLKENTKVSKGYYESYSEVLPSSKKIPLSHPKRVKEIIPFLKSPILDVGCGKGYDVNYFKQMGYEIAGCDISEEAIHEARKLYPDCNFFVHNFELDTTNSEFNCIYAFDVLEHVFDYPSFLKNIAHSLDTRGTFIITTPNILGLRNRISFIMGKGDYFDQMPHIRFFTPETIKKNLQRYNFQIIKVFGYSTLPLPPSLCGSLTIISEVRK